MTLYSKITRLNYFIFYVRKVKKKKTRYDFQMFLHEFLYYYCLLFIIRNGRLIEF